MWRRVAARRGSLSTHLVCCTPQIPRSKLLARLASFQSQQPSQCISPTQHQRPIRFFSQGSTGSAENEDFVGETAELSDNEMQNLGTEAKNGDAQMGVEQLSFSAGFLEEEGDVQIETFAVSEGEQEGVAYEIDQEELENVLSLLQSSTDRSLESSLEDIKPTLCEEFVVKVLETPLILGDNLINFFKWASNQQEFKATTRAVDVLVRSVSSGLRKRDAYALWGLVKEIGNKGDGILNADILNQLIALFSKLGEGKAALEVLDEFEGFGCVPNSDSYYFTIEAQCRRSFYDRAWSVCEKMIDSGSFPDSEKAGRIISWLCRGKMAKNAHLLYKLAKERSMLLPRTSVNFMIGSLCRENETTNLALELLDDFEGEARKYAIKQFSAVVRGLCRTRDVDGAKSLLLKMISEGPLPGNAVFNSVICGYCKAGNMEEATALMKLMETRGLKPDIYTYTVVMSGYTNGGHMQEACKVLSQAKKKHDKLSPVMYHTLIRGYCKLEEFDKALKLFGEMKNFGVQPNVDEYTKMIQSLCLKAADWDTAEKLLAEMKANGLHLNGITRGLIRAVKELEQEQVENEKTIEA